MRREETQNIKPNTFKKYLAQTFGCSMSHFLEALEDSPSSRGYILGALSEIFLRHHLEARGYEVFRIVEKPAGGNDAKSDEARGDFYVRPKGHKRDSWLVVESKGLKSNSEFRGSKLDSRDKVFRFLQHLAFPEKAAKHHAYTKGLESYRKARVEWEKSHRGKRFPRFSWDSKRPGPVACNLEGLWRNREGLQKYIKSLPARAFTEAAYRECRGAVAILETHKPSRRTGPKTGIEQAAPLVSDFSILAVDLFLRTGKHEFAFSNPKTLSHSPTSPEHLYQNYTIDVLLPGRKDRPQLLYPWFSDFDRCVGRTRPEYRKLDPTQIDHRQD